MSIFAVSSDESSLNLFLVIPSLAPSKEGEGGRFDIEVDGWSSRTREDVESDVVWAE